MSGFWKSKLGKRVRKYLVVRRDGTVPPWDWFVLAESDPAAPDALVAYADKCEELGNTSPQYVADVRTMAQDWAEHQGSIPAGDPGAPKHRTDDPITLWRLHDGDNGARELAINKLVAASGDLLQNATYNRINLNSHSLVTIRPEDLQKLIYAYKEMGLVTSNVEYVNKHIKEIEGQ